MLMQELYDSTMPGPWTPGFPMAIRALLVEEGQFQGTQVGGPEGAFRSAPTLVNGIYFPTSCGLLLRALEQHLHAPRWGSSISTLDSHPVDTG